MLVMYSYIVVMLFTSLRFDCDITLLASTYYSKHVCVCVCVCVCALREVTGSDSTSRQMLYTSFSGDGDCRPKRGCPVSWHP